jgi:hypothetical protein
MSLSLCGMQVPETKFQWVSRTVRDAEIWLWDDYKICFLSLFINNAS